MGFIIWLIVVALSAGLPVWSCALTGNKASFSTSSSDSSRGHCRSHLGGGNINNSDPLDLTNILYSLLGAIILLAWSPGSRGSVRKSPTRYRICRAASPRGLFRVTEASKLIATVTASCCSPGVDLAVGGADRHGPRPHHHDRLGTTHLPAFADGEQRTTRIPTRAHKCRRGRGRRRWPSCAPRRAHLRLVDVRLGPLIDWRPRPPGVEDPPGIAESRKRTLT